MHGRTRQLRLDRILPRNRSRNRLHENRHPPLLDGRTIDYSRLERQPGNEILGRFSYLLTSPPRPAALLDRLYQILACGFDDSPLFTGRT
jgi:hypothetical protein